MRLEIVLSQMIFFCFLIFIDKHIDLKEYKRTEKKYVYFVTLGFIENQWYISINISINIKI